MVNTDMIVPIVKIDRISAIGEALTFAGTSYGVLAGTAGDFVVTGSGSAGNKLANAPVKTLDFASGVTGGTVYFIPAYDFAGFKIAGTAVTATGTVNADGVSLYTAVLSDSAITVTAITPKLS